MLEALPASVDQVDLQEVTERNVPSLLEMICPWSGLSALTLRSVHLNRKVIDGPL